jgi:pimeloyl-ACP methyl ester carboxylesterase
VPIWLLLATGLATDSVPLFKVVVAPAESLHVVRIGSGDPVILIPGMFGSTVGFARLVPLLTAAGYGPIIIEPLGTGFSARPEHADYSLSAQADRLAAVLDSLHIRAAPVIAHSVGGGIVLRLAYRRPDLVLAVVSLEGGPTERAATPSFRRAMRFAPWIKIFGGKRLIRRVIHHSLIASSGDTSWVNDATVSNFTAGAAADLDAALKAFLAMAASREPEPLEPHLREIMCPVRLMVGGAPHNGGVGSREVDELRRDVSRFSLDSIPGAGHYLQEERPDAVVTALEQVKASASGAPR